MGKETFEVARIATPEDVADVLRALAAGLRRGEVSLESPKRTLRLTPAADLKLERRRRPPTFGSRSGTARPSLRSG